MNGNKTRNTRIKYLKLQTEYRKLKRQFENINSLLKNEQRLNKRLKFEKRELQYLLHTSISLINDLSSNFNDKIV